MNHPQLIILDQEGIKTLAELISKNINSENPISSKGSNDDEFLNIQEVSKLIGLTKPTIYGHVHRNTIPCIKKGKMLRFSKKDILNWLNDSKNQTQSELNDRVDKYLAKNKLF